MTKTFYSTLPVSGLPKGIATEAQLWDEIMKKMVYSAPTQLFPLIKEIHGKTYPPDTPVVPLATEYSVERVDSGTISSIRSDITVLIAARDIYHFECEIGFDGTMVMRMYEYDTHIALSYPIYSGSKLELNYPRSAVLYLQNNKNIPEYLTCTLHLPDDTVCEYRVPTLKVQSYSLEEIKSKHLSILIPFLPLRFRKEIQKENISYENIMNRLTSFLEEIILILREEVASGLISNECCETILFLLQKSLIRVTQPKPDLQKEVLRMTAPILELEIDKYQLEHKRLLQEVAERDQMLADKDQTIADKDQTIADKDQTIADNYKRIAELERALAEKEKRNT